MGQIELISNLKDYHSNWRTAVGILLASYQTPTHDNLSWRRRRQHALLADTLWSARQRSAVSSVMSTMHRAYTVWSAR